MTRYLNLNGNSNVLAYEISDSYIEVLFNGTSKIYRYSYLRAGVANVEKMKELAHKGCGLNSFIMRNVKKLYD